MKYSEQTRASHAEISNVNLESRTVDLTFSSEMPVDQPWGREVLSHAPGAADLSSLNNGAPLLFGHDKNDVRGVVERASIGADKIGRATVRFSKNPKGQEAFRDVQDKILRGVSVGYRIKDMKQTGGTAAAPEYTVTKWLPYEISIAPVPADFSVGFGRALADDLPTFATLKDNTMSKRENTDILAGISAREWRPYSLRKALLATYDPHNHAGYEREVSEEIGRITKRTTFGLFLPTGINVTGERTTSATAYGATINAGQGGANLVATQVLAGSFIDAVRAKCRVVAAGATLLPGLVGNAIIPRRSAGAAASWIGTEGADLPETEGIFDGGVTLSPKTVGSRGQVTRQLLLQSTPGIDALIQRDFAAIIGLAIDLAAINGPGTGGQPRGILNTAGIGSIAMGVNGAALSNLDPLIAMETLLATANIDEDAYAYLTTPKVVSELRTLKDSSGRYLWDASALALIGQARVAGYLNGLPVYRTTQVPSTLTKGTSGAVCSAAIFGNFSDLIIGEWGVLEILANQYGAGFNNGSVDIRTMQSIDVNVRHAASFCSIQDIL